MFINTIIIGAGPAGLMAANFIDKDVIILEKNPHPGKKLLLSGTGQCNFTNTCDIRAFASHYGEKKRFVQYSLSKFSNSQVIDFFERKNLSTFVRSDGKVFPRSLKSNDVLLSLRKSLNEKILCNHKVIDVGYEKNQFKIKTTKGDFSCKNLVIATGGRSYPKSGSTGDGFRFAENLGVPITRLYNGLCGIQTLEDCSPYSGIGLSNIKVRLIRHDHVIKDLDGDMLFTHKGLSGPVILNNARYMKPEDVLQVNYLNQSADDFDQLLIRWSKKHGKKNLINILKKLELPNRLIEGRLNSLDLSMNMAQVSKKQRRYIVEKLTQDTFKVKTVGSLHHAMVTVGGVDLSHINKKTMEYKNLKGLFFIGEVLDVDGDTGGYNIQWAFSSAYVASQRINEMKV